MNPLVKLREYGQSPWYDYIRRGLLTSGELQTLIEKDGLMGMTSNPSIFEKAIAGSSDYEKDLQELASGIIGVKQIYETLAVRDIQDAADAMRPVYEKSETRDGYVSLEVSPDLAYDTEGTIAEAVRLHKAVGRKNVMIKVPGTPEGLPAVEHLLSLGINVNITLLFSVDVYKEVAWTYIQGVEKLAANGGDVRAIASVASFFVSRIDTLVDSMIERRLKEETNDEARRVLESLKGKIAIANAKLAYEHFQEIFSSDRFAALKAKGAKVQRLLWASTSTKNPQYPDTYYVENLIGPETVNTMPAATFVAFKDHGVLRQALQEGVFEATETMNRLAEAGISMQEVTDQLLKDGAKLFGHAFDQLMGVINRKRQELLQAKLDQVTYSLGSIASDVDALLTDMQDRNVVRRLWAKDATLWHQDPGHQHLIRHALGWLTVIEQELGELPRLQQVAEFVKAEGFHHILLLGMGGSSLCPEVSRMTFGILPGWPVLHVLDSTVSDQVRAFEQRVDLSKTLCVVASKSGSTTEPLVFEKYFFDRMKEVVGDKAGDHFIAITDPGSLLEGLARDLGFRAIFPGNPEIGGRYSALSNFGMVPAGLMGVNVEHLLSRALRMRHSCDACVPPQDNPGMRLGATLGLLAKAGKDKLTFITSPAISDLGAWLEQLVAESTGKEDTGIIPVDGEPLGSPDQYGQDRLFAYVRYSENPDIDQDAKVTALEKAGHPVIRVAVGDVINLGEEFFLWEMGTAVAGIVLGINAFDQPNVQESKDYTKTYLEEYKRSGTLPEPQPFLTEGDLRLYADESNHQAFHGANTVDQVVAAHLGRVQVGDYVAINAYVERSDATHSIFQRIRFKVKEAKKVATTLGYGPRFLHSTGQLHKGGPNSGVFLQVTCDDQKDLLIPDEPYSFGVLKAAQALGDMKSLTSRNRRVIRVHIGTDVHKGLERLEQAIEAALKG